MSKSGAGAFGRAYTADAVNMRSEASFKVFFHQAFSVSKRFPLVKSGVANLVFDPTAHPGLITFFPIFFSATLAGPITIDLYVGTDSDNDGTLWPGVDRNFDNPIASNGFIRLNPTINNDGTKGEPEFLLPSNGTAAIATAGGQVSDSLIININTAAKYMFRLTNLDTVNDASCQVSAVWFELPALP